MTKLLTSNYRLDLAKRLINSISDTGNTSYYLYASDHMDNSNTSTILDNNDQKINKLYNTMLFGKKIKTNDAFLVIKNVPYQQGKVYKMYEHDVQLLDEDFYCVVDEDSYLHVYKCLDNNFNAKSTVEPSFAYFQSADNYISRLDDGYLWKYMYSVTNTIAEKFSVAGFFPIQANSSISNSAINGSIDVIKILDGGKGYNNYANGTFSTSDLRVNGNQKRYRINKASANGYLNDCLIYLTSGTGSGQYANIVTYFSNENGNFIDLDVEFIIAPQNQTQYEITPKIIIDSNGRETEKAIARGLVNAYSSNSIYRVEMLEKGKDYEYAVARVSANVNVGLDKTADLKLIYSPYGGHGKNAENELNATRACFSVKFSNTEYGTIPAKNNYKQIGVIKDPLFAKAQFTISNSTASFLPSETLYKINPVRLSTNATIVELSYTITVPDADFTNQLSVGKYLYLRGPNFADHQLVSVNSVVNSTAFTTTHAATFSCTNGYIYYANTSSSAKVINQSDAYTILLTNISGVFTPDDTIVGFSSGCKSTVNAISRNGTVKNFDTFIQMYKYIGTKTSGSLEEDDTIYQGTSLANSTASATLHSITTIGNEITFYASNQRGEFSLNESVFGESNAGVCAINTVLNPELIYGSGEVIYISSIEPIAREDDQTENFKIVFEF